MHLKLDDEILQVERRIAERKAALALTSRETGRRTLARLASPLALIVALAVGFFVAARRRRPPEDRRRKAKTAGIVGALLSGALWLVRAQYGSPIGLVQAVAAKLARREAAR